VLAQALAEGRALGPDEAMAELHALIQQADKRCSIQFPYCKAPVVLRRRDD
jgi:hypothetical protein